MASTISSPTIPCVEPLPGLLSQGNLIRITGTSGSTPICFALNLQNGCNIDPRSDIALHLSPVFTSPPRVVRNSLENQNWGPEESDGPYFPFAAGENFEILILSESDHFKIAINGQHFTEYSYRLPLQAISHLAIDGDVTINNIIFEGISKSPMDSTPGGDVNKPLGFVIEPTTQAALAPPLTGGRPSSPYGASALPYPTSFGPSLPSPTDNPYGPSPTSNPYGPAPNNPYGPPPQSNMYPSGRVSPSPYGPAPGATNPYGPPPDSNMYPSGRVSPSPYGPPPGSQYGPPQGVNQYGPPPGGYPYGPQQGYPQQSGYPHPGSHPQGYPYPSQPGPYPGTSVVYPGQEKDKSGFDIGKYIPAGAAALAGAAGASLLGGKKHKKNKKHKHGLGGMIPGMGAAGPAALLGGVGSMLGGGGGGKHGHHGSSSMGPMGGALAGGAAALAGTYVMGKVLKPKKFKKMKGGWGSSSSSSSSSD